MKRVSIALMLVVLMLLFIGCTASTSNEQAEAQESTTPVATESEVAPTVEATPTPTPTPAPTPTAESITFGQTISITDVAEITFNTADFYKDILPSDTSGIYSYLKGSGSDVVFVAVKGTIKNLATNAIETEDVISGGKFIFDNNYNYDALVETEGKDGTDFYNFDGIQPLGNGNFVVFAEVPIAVQDEDTKPLSLSLLIDGQDYQMTFR